MCLKDGLGSQSVIQRPCQLRPMLRAKWALEDGAFDVCSYRRAAIGAPARSGPYLGPTRVVNRRREGKAVRFAQTPERLTPNRELLAPVSAIPPDPM